MPGICRTPGFWGTHTCPETVDGNGNPTAQHCEKLRSTNLTQLVINKTATHSLTICGECLKNTALDDAASAQEAICVSPRGDQTLQLARQLTATALNCIMSQQVAPPIAGDVCANLGIGGVFDDCNNNVCLGNPSQLGLSVGDCINALDCFNNGGMSDGAGNCIAGGPNNCHNQPLCNQTLGICFNDPGPAGGSNNCNNAIGNACTITGPGEALCGADSPCP